QVCPETAAGADAVMIFVEVDSTIARVQRGNIAQEGQRVGRGQAAPGEEGWVRDHDYAPATVTDHDGPRLALDPPERETRGRFHARGAFDRQFLNARGVGPGFLHARRTRRHVLILAV